ncbi:MFS transporter [Nocardia takedensis]
MSEEPARVTRWWTLAIVSVGGFMLTLDLSAVNVALPDIRADLDADFTGIQWVFGAYALTLAVFLLSAGSRADALGRRRVFALGLAIFTVASALCGVANDILVLNLARAVQGIGGAVLFAVGPAMIGHEFHGRGRGVAFGVFGGVSGLAFAAGPLIGGGLTSGISWRWIFLLNVPLGLAGLVITAVRVRESRDARAPGIDLPGLVTFSAALTALVLAFLRGGEGGWSSPVTLALFAVAISSAVLFVATQRARPTRAMLDLSLFRNPTFVGLSAVVLLANMVGPTAIFLQANFVQNIWHLTPWETGLRFLPLTGTILVAGALAGSLITVIARRVLFFVSLVLLAAGLALTTLADQDSVWTVLLPSMILLGIGIGLFNPARATVAIEITEPGRAGMASGINETFQQVGAAVGIAALGTYFESDVAARFADSEASESLAGDAHAAGETVSSGAIGDVIATVSPDRQEAVRAAAETAFVDGLHLTMWVLTGLSLAGAVIGLLFIRQRDLYDAETAPVADSV